MLIAAIKKDTQLLLRDVGALASLFLLPLVFVAVFGSMFGGGGDEKARVLLVHHADGDDRAAALIAAIERSGRFQIRREQTPERVRALVADETFAVGLIVPPEFDPRAGVPAELVIDEAASPRFRGPVEGALEGMLRLAYLAGDDPAAWQPVLVARSPPGLAAPLHNVDGFQISVPGNAVLFGFFLALTVALSFVDERKTGTWRRLLAAPVHRRVVLWAKLVPYFLIGLIQMVFLFGAGALVFGMQVAGSYAALCVLTCAVVFCATGLGLFIASFGGTEKQLGAIGSICLLVMGLLGGAMVPRVIMPDTMQALGLVTPHAWALDGYYDVLVREGTGTGDIASAIAAVLGFGVAFAALGAWRFKFER